MRRSLSNRLLQTRDCSLLLVEPQVDERAVERTCGLQDRPRALLLARRTERQTQRRAIVGRIVPRKLQPHAQRRDRIMGPPAMKERQAQRQIRHRIGRIELERPAHLRDRVAEAPAPTPPPSRSRFTSPSTAAPTSVSASGPRTSFATPASSTTAATHRASLRHLHGDPSPQRSPGC